MCNNAISLLRYVEVRNVFFVVTSIINSVELALSGARTITIFVLGHMNMYSSEMSVS